MKTLLTSILLISAIVAQGAPAQRVMIPVNAVFAPAGFDSNDNTEILVSGYLPNLCYQSPSTEVKVVGNVIKINVTALSTLGENFFCAEMIVPFLESVNVGVLDKGRYNIEVNSGTNWERKDSIKINEALGTAIDEKVYANVDYIEKDLASQIVLLKGYNPSDCYEFDKFEISDNGKDTYSILPIMKKVREHCPLKMVPFELELEVPKQLKADTVLLHVRAMDGKSVNSLFWNN